MCVCVCVCVCVGRITLVYNNGDYPVTNNRVGGLCKQIIMNGIVLLLGDL